MQQLYQTIFKISITTNYIKKMTGYLKSLDTEISFRYIINCPDNTLPKGVVDACR